MSNTNFRNCKQHLEPIRTRGILQQLWEMGECIRKWNFNWSYFIVIVSLIGYFLLNNCLVTMYFRRGSIIRNNVYMFGLRNVNQHSSSVRNSRIFPVLFVSDEEEDINPFLSPSSNSSIKVNSNGGVNNAHREKVTWYFDILVIIFSLIKGDCRREKSQITNSPSTLSWERQRL